MLLYQGWYLHKEKDTSFFNIMYGKFWFDGEFFVQNLDGQREAPLELVAFTKIFFLLLTERYSFFPLTAPFFIHFTKDFLPLLIFP